MCFVFNIQSKLSTPAETTLDIRGEGESCRRKHVANGAREHFVVCITSKDCPKLVWSPINRFSIIILDTFGGV